MEKSAEERLSGIRLKIERAKKHIHELNAMVNEIRKLDLYEFLAEDNLDTGEHVRKVRWLDIPLPLEELGIVAGEVAHQLRSVLDHLACRLVDSGGMRTHDKDTGFPICKSPTSYKDSSPRKIDGIKPAAINLIESVQPYQAGYRGLGILQELNNIDKHRLLLVAAVKPRFASMTLTDGKSGMTMIGVSFDERIPSRDAEILKDGTVIGGFTGELKPGVQENFNVAFEIAFAEPKVVKGEPVIPLLTQLSGLVERVIGLFKPHL